MDMRLCGIREGPGSDFTPMFTLFTPLTQCHVTVQHIITCLSMFVWKQTFLNGLILLARHGMTDC